MMKKCSGYFISRSTGRDVKLLNVIGTKGGILAISCDSSGGIGLKPGDTYRASPDIVGYAVARVALMELVSIGALPLVFVDTLSVEMNPTGKAIICGIKRLIREMGYSNRISIHGSTEENIPVSVTGAGVVAIGKVGKEADLRFGKSKPGDRVLAAGIPKSAPSDDVRFDDPEIISMKGFRALISTSGVREIIPAGSSGIEHEAEVIARDSKLVFMRNPSCPLDLKHSAGPATSVILSVEGGKVEEVRKAACAPVYEIGLLVRRRH